MTPRIIHNIPSRLVPTEEFLTRKFRHIAAISSGNKIISYGECSLGGCRHVNKNLGLSCHAEINALKPLYSNLLKVG